MTNTKAGDSIWRPLVLTALVGMLVSPVLASPGGAVQPPRVNADAATIADFNKRVHDYLELHKKVDGAIKEPSKDDRPEMFVEHQIAFAKLMQKERPDAKPGDIFTKPMRNIVRKLLASVFRGPGGRQIKKSILDEYTGNIRLVVNTQYPEGAPVSTMPPQILEGLPKLPDGLEFRFIGPRLILLDSHARLIVDVVEHVFP
jgi:hypothetical protein